VIYESAVEYMLVKGWWWFDCICLCFLPSTYILIMLSIISMPTI